MPRCLGADGFLAVVWPFILPFTCEEPLPGFRPLDSAMREKPALSKSNCRNKESIVRKKKKEKKKRRRDDGEEGRENRRRKVEDQEKVKMRQRRKKTDHRRKASEYLPYF